ncbi:DNA polymerase subunit Cdc27 [Clohesyomyces aquaticus]|uniref:DNA polymerase delta subunit 3 n=1 Tax=Clohesyomyces aquaticus TaxID=1231657 RepID=A0A1Y1ZHI9_9PLEO|nr:DNA polymerase subunit Cdc27 [Clohesyomyces aquaticus]
MADTYKEYLAANVIADGKPVTYRVLSRALKVNVNIAKQMLYDFHQKQNAKKTNTVHATYILTGKKRAPEKANGIHTHDGEDSFMHSSPYMNSMPEPEEPTEEPPTHTSIVLVREEELEKTKSEFESITSMHIYSLEPGPLENLNLLSICNQDILKDCAGEEPLDRWKTYGSIHNPYIKRRTAKFAPAPAPGASKTAPKAASKPPVTAAAKEEQAKPASRRGSMSEDNSSRQPTPQPSSSSGTLKKSGSKPNLKRDTSDIFKSFAKAKAKPKEAAKSKESTPAPIPDERMQGMSEDEGDDDEGPQIKFDAEKQAAARKLRAEKEEALRKMMEDDDDEDMPDAPPAEEKESQDSPIDEVPSAAPAETASVTVQGGRRRGRRQVTKKKTVKDEEGYLVTKEEVVWESFSEDEPETKRPKQLPAKSTAKGKKGGKQSQGNIANFFKKS